MSLSGGADPKLDLLYGPIIQGRDLQCKPHKAKQVERGVQSRAKPKSEKARSRKENPNSRSALITGLLHAVSGQSWPNWRL